MSSKNNCQICGKNPAVVYFKHIAGSDVRELHICEECAIKNGVSLTPPPILTEFLFNNTKDAIGSSATSAKKCSVCGMTDVVYQEKKRLGCSECYKNFEDILMPIISGMQRGDQHIGKVPESFYLEVQTNKLQERMEKAVADQNFEEAAQIRDNIRQLKVRPVRQRMEHGE